MEISKPKLETILKKFEQPDEVRTFKKGKFEVVHLGGMTIGRATYQPGWRWSLHVGPSVGASRCNVEHVGMVVSGCATAAMEDGTVHEMRAGTLFYIFHLGRRDMTVGWSAMSHMCRCISWARRSMRTSSVVARRERI